MAGVQPRRIQPGGTVRHVALANPDQVYLLVRLDPATGEFKEIPLPVADAVPYVTRVDPRDGTIWIGTSAADALLRYEPRSGRFDTFPLPSRGALVRHLAVDPKSGAVWLAYGASPGIPARVARVVVK